MVPRLFSSLSAVWIMLFAACLPVQAWDAYGHMMVTSVAYARLNPQAQTAMRELAAQVPYPGETYTPITVACWMDDIRSDDPNIPYTGKFKKWHFITWGHAPGDANPPIEPGDDNDTKKGNILQGLRRAVAVLQGRTDPLVPNKALALAIVCHLVGDAHQPLHCASHYFVHKDGKILNDGGGNRVQIDNAPEVEAPMKNKMRYNLHSFWDEAYRGQFDPATRQVVLNAELRDYTKKDLNALQGLVSELTGFDPKPGTSLEPDFLAWARESNALARDWVYPKLPRFKLNLYATVDQAYTEEARKIARERIVLAGWRLAVLLNRTLGGEDGFLPPLPETPWPAALETKAAADVAPVKAD